MSVCTFSCVRRGICRSIAPEVVYQRVVVQVASSRHLAELAISPGGRCRARGTCVRVHIFVRTERNLSVDRARGGLSESCRTSRLHLQLSRMGEFSRRKVSSTWYMCPCGHFRAYGEEFVGRSRPRWSIRELSYKSPPAATYPSGRFRLAEGFEHVVHVLCAHFRAYGEEFVGRSRPRWSIRELSYKSPPVQLSRVGDFARRKESSTWYMCPCAHFRAYGVEIDARSSTKWSIRELSYKSSPPAT